MADHPKIVVLDRYQTGESANPSPEKILAGIPRTRVSNQFTDADAAILLRLLDQHQRQMARALYGTRVLRADRGPRAPRVGHRREARIARGRCLRRPGGFEGTWEVAEPCKKWYAVFEVQDLSASRAVSAPASRVSSRSRITPASVSTICAICFGSMINGGDSAIMSPVTHHHAALEALEEHIEGRARRACPAAARTRRRRSSP